VGNGADEDGSSLAEVALTAPNSENRIAAQTKTFAREKLLQVFFMNVLREHYRRKELTIRRDFQKKDSPFSDSSTLSLHLILRGNSHFVIYSLDPQPSHAVIPTGAEAKATAEWRNLLFFLRPDVSSNNGGSGNAWWKRERLHKPREGHEFHSCRKAREKMRISAAEVCRF
jgi:hypothetical protein